MMKYISTSGQGKAVDFRQAVLQGLAPDGGLYVPQTIPRLSTVALRRLEEMPLDLMATELLLPYVRESLSYVQLQEIVRRAFHFPLPLISCSNGIHILELFHGPTWAFKDAGAGFLAGCLGAWTVPGHKTAVLVATSGDTGGAVAHSFLHRANTEVFILYPKARITVLQEEQIAGLGDNVYAIAVNGTFDDCQRLVRAALRHRVWNSTTSLTSANSINLARWLPQLVFFAKAHQEAVQRGIPLNLSIPSGNAGNFTAAFLLHLMGYTFDRLIAGHNANDTMPRFFQTGRYHPLPTIHTLANAMDVSDPGNVQRLTYLMPYSDSPIGAWVTADSVSDEEILKTIREVWDKYQYLLDPHTATAWRALARCGKEGIVVATAHPYKFEEVIKTALGHYPEPWRKVWHHRQIQNVIIPPTPDDLFEILSQYLGEKEMGNPG